ncbi:MAG: hypothetical protein ABIG84_03580 [archaeon]
MAKPIPTTPILTGKDAERFLKRMKANERSPMTKREKEIAKALNNFRCNIK